MNYFSPPTTPGVVFISKDMPTIITQTRNGENKIWICTKCGGHGSIALTFDCEYNANQHAQIVHSDYENAQRSRS